MSPQGAPPPICDRRHDCLAVKQSLQTHDIYRRVLNAAGFQLVGETDFPRISACLMVGDGER